MPVPATNACRAGCGSWRRKRPSRLCLSDARASNERLSSRVRELEAKAAQPPVSSLAVEASTDDLTRIRGIGPKVASQLHELGINCFSLD
jgi:predicted flap endonuclease-1-like 5' DNA nuclease